jgi:DNA-binding response OmpR family regulator
MKKVIIIEDDHDSLEAFSILLKDEGFKVFGFLDGTSILERTCCILPDIIIIDVFLEREDGRQICRLIKNTEAIKKIPVLLISAGESRDFPEMYGADGFIQKPFSLSDMHGIVQKT